MKKILGIALVLALVFSCKKEIDYTPLSEYLTGGKTKSWYLSEYYVNGQPASLDDCEMDDVLVLKANMSFQIVGGAVECNAGEASVHESGEWRVSSDDKTFYLFGVNAFGYEGKINSLTHSRFRTSFIEEGNEYIYVYKTN